MLAERLNDLLPQTQCTKCGYQGCKPYAQALATEGEALNRCPPGGRAGIAALAALLQQPLLEPDQSCGGLRPLHVALIDEQFCIGCTLCIQACPVDAIVGASKLMHTVVPEQCTGCDLCVAPCPVDCITMVPVSPARAWTTQDASAARARFERRQVRLAHEPESLRQSPPARAPVAMTDTLAATQETTPAMTQAADNGHAAGLAETAKQATITQALTQALARARARRATHPAR
jgi:Na+-translocating ferredoxin:NAD+ oxidoreductase subunit B